MPPKLCWRLSHNENLTPIRCYRISHPHIDIKGKHSYFKPHAMWLLTTTRTYFLGGCNRRRPNIWIAPFYTSLLNLCQRYEWFRLSTMVLEADNGGWGDNLCECTVCDKADKFSLFTCALQDSSSKVSAYKAQPVGVCSRSQGHSRNQATRSWPSHMLWVCRDAVREELSAGAATLGKGHK